MIRSHFSGVMSSDGVEGLDAGAGDEDLDRARARRGPRANAGVDRRPVGDVDLDGRARRRRRRSSSAAASAAAPLRSRRATRWPSATSCRATPSPMPDAPPVTTATRLIGVGLDRVELEVELGEAAEDPRRLVAEAAVAGRAVVLLGQADVAHPVEDALEADPALGPGERAAGAGVGAAPEGDVGLGVGPVDAELVRALEAPGVAVGGAVEQHHRRAGLDVDAADRRGAPGEAEVGLHRALDPQHLLEEVGDPVVVGPQLRPGARGARPGASARRRAGGRWSPGRRRTGTSRCARPR